MDKEELNSRDSFIMNLKFIMLERNLTQDDVGKLAGHSKQWLSKILHKDDFNISTADKIGSALGFNGGSELFDENFRIKYLSKKDV